MPTLLITSVNTSNSRESITTPIAGTTSRISWPWLAGPVAAEALPLALDASARAAALLAVGWQMRRCILKGSNTRLSLHSHIGITLQAYA